MRIDAFFAGHHDAWRVYVRGWKPPMLVRQDGQYLTPNGNHRLTALKELGARCIVGLLVPEVSVA